MAVQYKPPQIPDVPTALKQFGKIAVAVTEERVLEFAKGERSKFIDRIKRQNFKSFRVHPLSRKWHERKLAKGADGRVHIATTHMIRSIQLFVRKDSVRAKTIHIGFNRRTLARDLDHNVVPTPVHKIAALLEKGSAKSNLPPRPTWKPHLQDMKKRAVLLREKIKTQIRRETLVRSPTIRGS